MYQYTSSRSLRAILVFSRSTRRCFASENNNSSRARNYLDAWVGSSSASDSQTTPSIKPRQPKSKQLAPLLLSGSSYLIPTLRIERSDTPENISTRIAAALEDSHHPQNNTGVVKSMLRGKVTKEGRSAVRWQAPIILDFAALIPDGSPHYQPPRRGLLTEIVKVLRQYNIRVVGVTNTPPVLEEEAVETLGLPGFISKGRFLDRQSATSKVGLDQVVEMLIVKSQQDGIEETDELSNELFKREETSAEVATAKLADGTESTEDTPTDSATIETRNDDECNAPTADPDEPSSPTPTHEGTYVYQGSVRSGQQVTAPQNQSLLVIGSVSSGGEVMSDRDVFVLGKLRGRALAGLATNQEESGGSRIFATSFDAELVCIGDTFTTVDSVTELGLEQPGDGAMVTLNSHRELVFQRIPL